MVSRRVVVGSGVAFVVAVTGCGIGDAIAGRVTDSDERFNILNGNDAAGRVFVDGTRILDELPPLDDQDLSILRDALNATVDLEVTFDGSNDHNQNPNNSVFNARAFKDSSGRIVFQDSAFTPDELISIVQGDADEFTLDRWNALLANNRLVEVADETEQAFSIVGTSSVLNVPAYVDGQNGVRL